MSDVVIHYRRLPDRDTIFRQRLVHRGSDCTVTLMSETPLSAPVRAGGKVILEPDAPVVWFTFDGAWHDIGRFHTADGVFTGFYANIITPVRWTAPLTWATTDLFLDVFRAADDSVQILDEDELEAALRADWISAELAQRAREEAAALADAARADVWPPAVARQWTLERARGGTGTADSGTPGGAAV